MVKKKLVLIMIGVIGLGALGRLGSILVSRRSVTVEPIAVRDPKQLWTQERGADRAPASTEWVRRYRFRREIRATTPEKPILQFDLRGTLELTRQGPWLRGQFQLDKGRDHGEIRSTIPFYFLMNPAGEITEIRSSGDADQQSILKDLALIFAYRTRIDTAGEVELRFTDLAKGEEILKEKVRYSGPIAKHVKIKKSEHRIRRDLSLLTGVEITEMGKIETYSSYELKLEKTGDPLSARVNPELVAQYPVVPLLVGEVAEGVEERPVVSWKVLRSQLARIGKSKSSHRMKLFHEFIRTLRQDPAAMGEFKDWMSHRRRADADGYRDFMFGLGVLGALGTPGAQRELMAFHRQQADPAILNALTTMQAPITPETREYLRGLSRSDEESKAMPALFALGASLRSSEDPEEQARVIELLQQRYESAPTVSAKMDVLDAMGNSGHSSFLPLLTSVIENPDSPQALVTKAIFAMRLMKDAQAGRLLRRLATDERYASYQSTIESALRYQRRSS